MATWVVGTAAGLLVGANWGKLRRLLLKESKAGDLEERSTTSSAGGGTAAYETKKAVDEYLQFHFGANQDILPYPHGPQSALNFTARLAELCARFVQASVQEGSVAIDVGCAVGGASFELARSFGHVIGVDYSHAFIDAAQEMQEVGSREYQAVLEGDIKGRFTAHLPGDIPRDRVEFMQGDACALPASLPKCDAVLAANLLCRLPDPIHFIDRLPTLVKPGGVAVLVSPYSWLPAWTPKDKWFGAKYSKDGKPMRSADVVTELMTARGFELVHQEDVPFLIREHLRKYQWGCSHATVWRRTGA